MQVCGSWAGRHVQGLGQYSQKSLCLRLAVVGGGGTPLPLLWLVPLLELVPLVVSLGARTRKAKASPKHPRSPPSCRKMTDKELSLFPSCPRGLPLHPGYRASRMSLTPSDYQSSCPAGGRWQSLLYFLAGQGLFDFFLRVAHTHHHLLGEGDERRFSLPRSFPSTLSASHSNVCTLACPVIIPLLPAAP